MMIEETIAAYLKDNASVPWFAMRPPAYEDNANIGQRKYGLFEKTSSRKADHVVYSTIAFQSYAPTLLEAAQISAELRELMEQLPNTTAEVSKAQLNSEYNFTNTADKQPRYQAVFSLVHFEDF
jgi:predicted choloylglycine hydrolase